MVYKNTKDLFKRWETLQKFSRLGATKFFLRPILFFDLLRDCVEMFRSNSSFVALLMDGESSDGSVNRGGKRIQILTVCSVFCFLRREQFS